MNKNNEERKEVCDECLMETLCKSIKFFVSDFFLIFFKRFLDLFYSSIEWVNV